MQSIKEALKKLLQCRLSVVIDDSVVELNKAICDWHEIDEAISEMAGGEKPDDIKLKITGAMSEALEINRTWNGSLSHMPEGNVGPYCTKCNFSKYCQSYQNQ